MIIIFALAIASDGIIIQDRLQQTVQQTTEFDQRLFSSYGSVDEETYSGAEVLQSIQRIAEINADIQVSGQMFVKTLDIDSVDVSVVNLHKTYKVQYIRNSTGDVTTIVFT